MKIKIQKRADKFGEKTHFKKGQVVVSKWSRKPSIMVVVKDSYEKGDILCYEEKNIPHNTHWYHLRLATPSEKKLLGTRKFAEVEFIEDKPKAVKPKIQEMPKKEETNQIEVEILKAEIAKYRKQVNELESQAKVWENHAKFVEGKLIEAEQELKVYIAENNKFGNKIIELEKETRDQFSRINSLLISNNDLKNELSVALEKIDSLGDEIYLFKQTIHQLTK